MPKARKYTCPIIEELLAEITPLQMKQVKFKMLLAAQIEDLVRANGLTNIQIAAKLGNTTQEVEQWFSGTHDFTIDTLIKIAFHLDANLIVGIKPS